MCSQSRQNEKSNELKSVSQSQRKIKNLEFTKGKQLEVKIKDWHVIQEKHKARSLGLHQFGSFANVTGPAILTWLIPGESPSPFSCLSPQKAGGVGDTGRRGFQILKTSAYSSASVITIWLLLSDFSCYYRFLRPASWWFWLICQNVFRCESQTRLSKSGWNFSKNWIKRPAVMGRRCEQTVHKINVMAFKHINTEM